MSLAAKLPYNHAYANGFGYGGQTVPTDVDAISYLESVAAADGASLEVGIASNIDRFIKACKADSAGYAGDPSRTVWDAIKASCIMCGARTLDGALVPLKRPYGAELWANQSPTIFDGTGSNTGAWISATSTMVCNGVGPESTRPRFDFNVGTQSGKNYRITGRVTGDYVSSGFRFVIGGSSAYPDADGYIDSTLPASGSTVLAYLNGTLGASSVTIESLSIREDSFTPTPHNFISEDYNRITGLSDPHAASWLDSNRANDADGQDDFHAGVYVTSDGTITSGNYFGSDGTATAGGTNMYDFVASLEGACRGDGVSRFVTTHGSVTGLKAMSRDDSGSYLVRTGLNTSSSSIASTTPTSRNIFVFARNDATSPPQFVTDARLAFYSIGSAIPNLDLLDTRVTNLVNGLKFYSYTNLNPADYDEDTVNYIVSAYESGGSL